jgi:hypothetical protein
MVHHLYSIQCMETNADLKLFLFSKTSVADRDSNPADPYVLDLLDPDPLVRGTDPDPDPSIMK